ncbi:hypothetical protein SeMB42_g07109 [Synchytrium endobioticum]|uniref:Mannose-6-phosphate isomerase n=1 Tax=Synchytrium endobioticum TaxID=286115 RepID=A0A507CDE5_9FUNG|nr:mannose-6-phosphate isomerase [Synchytrium endobioticum]TPX36066.1 hypothetical protein SeMB42_g07109 [Synchytrium endobioticum]
MGDQESDAPNGTRSTYASGDTAIARLEYAIQSYDWGKLGASSKVATCMHSHSSNQFLMKEDTPYAELWMGTHPNGPSVVNHDDDDGSHQPKTHLKHVLSPRNLSAWCNEKFQGDIPFLFKVLSIAKALSIQAHPDKALAEELHAKRPDLYKDSNHKPEMAIALTPFEALIGFRPLPEIAQHLSQYPEFKSLIGDVIATSFIQASATNDTAVGRKVLTDLFGTLVKSNASAVSQAVKQLVQRINSRNTELRKGSTDELVARLDSQFPGDVGIFCAMMLNYVELHPGEAIYLAANEPHAYISGDCVECMAASDNVVRSGLTPKFKDVETLVSMLTYNYGPANSQILRGAPYKHHSTKHTLLYDPPIEEFSVLRTHLEGASSEHYDGMDGPSILIVTDGSGVIDYEYASDGHEARNGKMDAKTGFCFFIGADVKVMLSSTSDASTFYRAFCAPCH